MTETPRAARDLRRLANGEPGLSERHRRQLRGIADEVAESTMTERGFVYTALVFGLALGMLLFCVFFT